MSPPRTIVLTGATDGIGLALARRYHEAGDRLLLIGRRGGETLQEPLFDAAQYASIDLGRPAAEERVVRMLEGAGIDAVDLLVNNAALGRYGPVEDDAPEDIAALCAVNLGAPVALTHALEPYLARARGKVVFVSSVVEALPCAKFAVYAATKAALDGFARSLRVEWARRIRVQVIHPGAVRTGFHARSGVPERLVSSKRIPDAASAARRMQRLIDGNRPAPTLGLANRLARFAGRRLSRPLDWLARRAAR